ncbi:MAG: hypothetical protein OXP75_06190 [Rhodospirillales bacterium]|nr:hypothetical protein [Rhodospirillales bacterium]
MSEKRCRVEKLAMRESAPCLPDSTPVQCSGGVVGAAELGECERTVYDPQARASYDVKTGALTSVLY